MVFCVTGQLERLAFIELKQKKYVQAEKLFNKVINYKKNVFGKSELIDYYYNLSYMYKEQKKYSRAEKYIDLAIKQLNKGIFPVFYFNPDKWTKNDIFIFYKIKLFNEKALLLLNQNKFNEAEKILKEILEIKTISSSGIQQKNNACQYEYLSKLYLKRNDKVNTLRMKNKALEEFKNISIYSDVDKSYRALSSICY